MSVNLFTPDGGAGVNKDKGATPRARSLARDRMTESVQFSNFPNLPEVVGLKKDSDQLSGVRFPSAGLISADSLPALAGW